MNGISTIAKKGTNLCGSNNYIFILTELHKIKVDEGDRSLTRKVRLYGPEQVARRAHQLSSLSALPKKSIFVLVSEC